MTSDFTADTQLRSLIRDAEYVVLEIARGDAVPAAALANAKPFIDPLVLATLAASTDRAGAAEFRTLQNAMIDLMAAIAPVTVSSLRDTDTSLAGNETGEAAPSIYSILKPRCVAARFSNNLFVITIAFLIAAIYVTVVANPFDGKPARDVIEVLLPVVYGGLGACVYLLRALHKRMHDRTFDRRYQPEYYNRAILGVIGGSVTTMLIQISGMGKDALATDIGPAAVAFLVGYNTDLLFSLIERISNALFPKVPEPPAPAVTPPVTPAQAPVDVAPPVPGTVPAEAGKPATVQAA